MAESREQIEVDADWFDRKVQQRKDYLEVHPRGMSRLEVMEMTDQELLELAAKAAEIDTFRPEYDGSMFIGFRQLNNRLWNPLANDGDILRLVVKLDLDILHFWPDETAEYPDLVEVIGGNALTRVSISWPLGADPYAATRRAIVLAVAEIGRRWK